MRRPVAGESCSGLRVLTYHAFGLDRVPTSIDPSRFADTLGALDSAGFRCVDLGDWIARGRPYEPRGYALAFDDGLASILRIVDAMERYRARASVFLVTNYVGHDNRWPGQPSWVPRERLLDWSEIRALADRGFRFEAHTATHPRLDRLDDKTLRRELRTSRDAIEGQLGQHCSLLAYPYGASTGVVRRVARESFAAAFGTRLDLSGSRQDIFNLSRIEAHYFRSDRNIRTLTRDRLAGRLLFRRTLRLASALRRQAHRSAITSRFRDRLVPSAVPLRRVRLDAPSADPAKTRCVETHPTKEGHQRHLGGNPEAIANPFLNAEAGGAT